MSTHMDVTEFRKLAAKGTYHKRTSKHAEEKAAAKARRDSFRVGTEPVKFRLPFPPSLDGYYKHGVLAGHSHTYLSAEGKDYRRMVIEAYRAVGVTFEGRLAIKVIAVFPDERKYDLDGLWKALLDGLEHAGAYVNDNQIAAESMENERIEKPGCMDIILGPKPGCGLQGTLFETNW